MNTKIIKNIQDPRAPLQKFSSRNSQRWTTSIFNQK